MNILWYLPFSVWLTSLSMILSRSIQGYGFFSSHVWMWELDYKESWVQKNWCFWTVVLEKTLESPLDCKEIQPVHLKGDQSWVFIGRTDVEAETPTPLATWCRKLLIWKDPDAGKDWGQEEKGTTEDEMVGWHHRHNGHGSGWTLEGLACFSSWGCKQSDMTEWLNWTELKVHPCCGKWHCFCYGWVYIFYSWVACHCIYGPHLLYPLICWWAFRLLSCLGYCK